MVIITPKIQTLIDEYLVQKRSEGKSDNSLKSYRADLNNFLKFIGLDQNLDSLREFSVLKNYAEKLSADAGNTHRRRLQTLKGFLDFLLQRELIKENPSKKLFTPTKKIELPQPANVLELKKLQGELQKEIDCSQGMKKLWALRNMLIFLFIYEVGLKVSEINKIKDEQVILNAHPPRLIVSTPKRDPYTIPLTPNCCSFIDDYLPLKKTHQEKEKLSFNHFFFNGNQYKILGSSISPRGIEFLFQEFERKLKLKITPKTLRQAAILEWLRQGKAPESIKEWMGVAPDYSLKPYTDLLNKKPQD